MAATPSTGVGATPLAGCAEAIARRFSRAFKTPSSGLTGPAAPTRGVCGRASRLTRPAIAPGRDRLTRQADIRPRTGLTRLCRPALGGKTLRQRRYPAPPTVFCTRPNAQQTLVATPEGLPLAYERLAGDTADNTTLRDFLAKIEAQYGKARRIFDQRNGSFPRRPRNASNGRKARLQGSPREGPESGREPSFHCERDIAFTARCGPCLNCVVGL
jgi:hypothetical protein